MKIFAIVVEPVWKVVMKEHTELKYLRQGIHYLKEHNIDMNGLKNENETKPAKGRACGCPGGRRCGGLSF